MTTPSNPGPTVQTTITGIILAAGEGRRFGGPKALASLGDENFTSICVRKLLAAGINDIIVVTGASSTKVEDAVQKCRRPGNPCIRFVPNGDWKEGVASSIRKGFDSVPASSAGVLLMAVNYPLVHEETIQLLIDLFMQEPEAGNKVLVPIYEGLAGMPVMVGRDLFDDFEQFAGEDPLISLTRLVPSRSVCVAVEDRGAFFGITTRDDLVQAIQLMLRYDFEPT